MNSILFAKWLNAADEYIFLFCAACEHMKNSAAD